METLGAIAQIATALATIAAVVAVFYAAKQLHLQRNVSRGEFLFHLYELLDEHRDLHYSLKSGQWPPGGTEPSTKEWAEIGRYIGLFEAVQLLVRDKILTVEEVDRLLGHRIASLHGNTFIRERCVGEEKVGWQDFNKLLDGVRGQRVFRDSERELKQRAARPNNADKPSVDEARPPDVAT